MLEKKNDYFLLKIILFPKNLNQNLQDQFRVNNQIISSSITSIKLLNSQ